MERRQCIASMILLLVFSVIPTNSTPQQRQEIDEVGQSVNTHNDVNYFQPSSLDVKAPPPHITPTNVTASPIQTTYQVGQKVTCYANAHPPPRYYWQSLKTSEVWNSQSFTIRSDMIGYQLIQCVAYNTHKGRNYTNNFSLDVNVEPPNAPPTNVSASPIQTTYQVGQTVTCHADAYPPPRYFWQSLRNQEIWNSQSFAIRLDMTGLQIMRCTAINTFNGVDHTTDFFMDVYVEPTNSPPTNMSASPIQSSYKVGDTVTCYADAYPPPSYYWQSLRSGQIWNSQSFTLHSNMTGYQLMVCTAYNTFNGVNHTGLLHLDVYITPPHSPPTNVSVSPIQEKYPVGARIECNANAFPGPRFQWQNVKTGEIWNTQDFYVTSEMVPYQLMRCRAYHTYNGVNYTADYFLDLYSWFPYPPPTNVSVSPLQATYEVGQRVTCYADAETPPKFFWMNMKTSETWSSQSFTIRSDMIGYQRMRCRAYINYLALTVSDSYYLDLVVSPPTNCKN